MPTVRKIKSPEERKIDPKRRGDQQRVLDFVLASPTPLTKVEIEGALSDVPTEGLNRILNRLKTMGLLGHVPGTRPYQYTAPGLLQGNAAPVNATNGTKPTPPLLPDEEPMEIRPAQRSGGFERPVGTREPREVVDEVPDALPLLDLADIEVEEVPEQDSTIADLAHAVQQLAESIAQQKPPQIIHQPVRLIETKHYLINPYRVLMVDKRADDMAEIKLAGSERGPQDYPVVISVVTEPDETERILGELSLYVNHDATYERQQEMLVALREELRILKGDRDGWKKKYFDLRHDATQFWQRLGIEDDVPV